MSHPHRNVVLSFRATNLILPQAKTEKPSSIYYNALPVVVIRPRHTGTFGITGKGGAGGIFPLPQYFCWLTKVVLCYYF